MAAAADYFYSSAVRAPPPRWPWARCRSCAPAAPAAKSLKDLAGSGWSVLIFPSGTRGAGASGFQKGFAYIAVDAQVPVVPMYLHGLEQVMPKGSFVLPRRGGDRHPVSPSPATTTAPWSARPRPGWPRRTMVRAGKGRRPARARNPFADPLFLPCSGG